MYDNIGFYIDNTTAKCKSILSHILQNGDDLILEKHGKDNNDISFAYISIVGKDEQKLTFMVTPYILKLTGKNSSICKFYLGNNFDTLTLKQFNQAINDISEKLSVDIRKARVCRIDISTNFSMVHVPSLYHSCLKDLSRFQKVDYSGNLYFKTRKVELNFYDKIKEYKQKGIPAPKEFADSKNLLRYEIRFKKSVAKTFGKTVTIYDLCDEIFFKSVVQKWRDRYWNITKMNPIVFQSPDSTFKTTDFKNYFMFKGMESTGGFDVVYKSIESSKKAGTIGKYRASYLKKATRKIYDSSVAESQISYDFINELNEKMRLFKPQIE